MSEKRFTDGPWSIFSSGRRAGEEEMTLFTIAYGTNSYGDGPQGTVAELTRTTEANARLIAAAPCMLAELDCREGDLVLLRRAIEEGDPKAELLVRIDDMLRETRAALAKARGES